MAVLTWRWKGTTLVISWYLFKKVTKLFLKSIPTKCWLFSRPCSTAGECAVVKHDLVSNDRDLFKSGGVLLIIEAPWLFFYKLDFEVNLCFSCASFQATSKYKLPSFLFRLSGHFSISSEPLLSFFLIRSCDALSVFAGIRWKWSVSLWGSSFQLLLQIFLVCLS